ncbi:hypothetical protein M405DRAFT_419724 [Rhizopogon salebrosus TDB-379]|nr:hypothetical protein M405DRAFT_419724 [Rhizopogon salebrosus TDB-379]
MTKHRAIANASRHDALLSTHGHPSSPRSRSQTAFHDKLNDAAGSDSSIEIFEGNLFAENSVKGTNLKETKPYASWSSSLPRFEMLYAQNPSILSGAAQA